MTSMAHRLVYHVCALIGLSLVSATPASSADSDGDYAIRGAGALQCEVFIDAARAESGSSEGYVRWFEGYLSAVNRVTPDTYDLSPLTEIRDVALLVLNVCTAAPDTNIESALANVLDTLRPIRNETLTELLTLEHEGVRVRLRKSTMIQIQEALTEEGYYSSTIDGLYGPGTRTAIIRHQEANGLEATGLPDGATLLSILLD